MRLDMILVLWGALTVLFVVVELATTALVSIWFVIGALAAFVAALFDLSFLYQCCIFIGTSVVALACTRAFVRHFHPPVTPTNSDMVLGQTATVTLAIGPSNSVGRVDVQHDSWQAKSSDGSSIPSGTVVKIDRIVGVTVFVSPLNSAE